MAEADALQADHGQPAAHPRGLLYDEDSTDEADVRDDAERRTLEIRMLEAEWLDDGALQAQCRAEMEQLLLVQRDRAQDKSRELKRQLKGACDRERRLFEQNAASRARESARDAECTSRVQEMQAELRVNARRFAGELEEIEDALNGVHKRYLSALEEASDRAKSREQELEASKAQLNYATQDASNVKQQMQQLCDQHEQQVRGLHTAREEACQKLQEQVEEMQLKNESDMQELEQEMERRQKQFEEQRSKEREEMEWASAKELEKEKERHENQLTLLRLTNEKEREESVAIIDQQVQRDKEQHQKDLEQLRDRYEQRLEELRLAYEKEKQEWVQEWDKRVQREKTQHQKDFEEKQEVLEQFRSKYEQRLEELRVKTDREKEEITQEMGAEIEQHERQLEAVRANLEDYKGQLEVSAQRTIWLQERLDQANTSAAVQRDEDSAKISGMTAQMDELHRTVQSASDQIASLERLVDELEAQAASAQEETLTCLAAAREQAAREQQALQLREQQALRQVQQLQAQRDNDETARESLLTQVQSLQQKLDEEHTRRADQDRREELRAEEVMQLWSKLRVQEDQQLVQEKQHQTELAKAQQDAQDAFAAAEKAARQAQVDRLEAQAQLDRSARRLAFLEAQLLEVEARPSNFRQTPSTTRGFASTPQHHSKGDGRSGTATATRQKLLERDLMSVNTGTPTNPFAPSNNPFAADPEDAESRGADNKPNEGKRLSLEELSERGLVSNTVARENSKHGNGNHQEMRNNPATRGDSDYVSEDEHAGEENVRHSSV